MTFWCRGQHFINTPTTTSNENKTLIMMSGFGNADVLKWEEMLEGGRAPCNFPLQLGSMEAAYSARTISRTPLWVRPQRCCSGWWKWGLCCRWLASKENLVKVSKEYNGRKRIQLSTSVWGAPLHTERGPMHSTTGWMQWCPLNGICCFISRGRDNQSFHCHTQRGIINQPGSNCLQTSLVTTP